MTFDIDNIHQQTEEGHIYGVHCGDANCYSCTKMKGECSWLDTLDKLEDKKNADLEAQDFDTFGEDKI